MTIDSHQHFWNYDPIRDKWIESSMKILQKDFLPKDLKPNLDDNGIAVSYTHLPLPTICSV